MYALLGACPVSHLGAGFIFITLQAMAIQLAEGACIAMEVKSRDPHMDVVAEFSKICGPRDPVSVNLK